MTHRIHRVVQSTYDGDPLVVHVSPKEAGAKAPHVVLVYLVSAARIERFEAAHTGRLSSKSMTEVDGLLRLALDVPEARRSSAARRGTSGSAHSCARVQLQ